LCVLLAHALAIFFLLRLGPNAERRGGELETAPITLFFEALPAAAPAAPSRTASVAPAVSRRPAAAPAPAAEVTPAESGAITIPGRVDWPIEGRKSAARVLAAEAEA